MRRSILVLLLATTISVLAGCGGNSTSVQNPPPPPPPTLSVAFQPAPVSALLINANAQITAVVTDDPGNYGVDWLLTCPTGSTCGSLSSLHSDSGAPVTYTPPQKLSGNNQAVTITAFATADHTKNVVAPIMLSAFASALKGTYTFQTKGADANLQPYQLTGALVLDGNGGITSGEQIANFVAGSFTTSIAQGSSYFVGADGRGTLTIKTLDQYGQALTETFGLIVLSPAQASIAELDSPQSSTGTMELQTGTGAALTGGYAFALSGTDTSGTPTVLGGIFNVDSPGNISGSGGVGDQDYFGSLFTCDVDNGPSGTVTTPSPNPFGKVTVNLNGANCFGSVVLTGYIVDATHVRLIETDNNGSGGFSTAGLAVAQGSATGTFTLASISGKYVFGILGQDLNSGYPSSFTSVNVVATDGAGHVTNGVTDTFMLDSASFTPTQISTQLYGNYKIDPKAVGRVRLFLNFNPPPIPGFRPGFIFYLTGNGQPPLVLDAGGEDLNYPSLGVGIAYPQAATLSFSGKYGVSFTQQNGNENDGIGQMTAGSASLTGTLNDSAAGAGTSISLSDHFGSPDSNGRSAGTFMGNNVVYYLIDANHGIFVETDLVNPGSGQLALGQFSVRTPVCTTCP